MPPAAGKIHSTERTQPFRGGHAVRPIPTVGAAVDFYVSAYGYSEQAAAVIIGSAEYFANRGNNDNTDFLEAVYEDALGRPIDPTGELAFSRALAIGASGRIWWSLRVKEVPLSYFIEQPYLLVVHE